MDERPLTRQLSHSPPCRMTARGKTVMLFRNIWLGTSPHRPGPLQLPGRGVDPPGSTDEFQAMPFAAARKCRSLDGQGVEKRWTPLICPMARGNTLNPKQPKLRWPPGYPSGRQIKYREFDHSSEPPGLRDKHSTDCGSLPLSTCQTLKVNLTAQPITS